MHRLVLGNPFVALVAPFLLGVLAHKLLSERRARAQRNEEDLNPGTPSSPIPPSDDDYEVFLSFRGVDTRKGFTDYLYHSLVDAGIRVFCVEEALRAGEIASAGLRKAIANSKILIPIISENYASSTSCLRELVQMIERQKRLDHVVLPIFYKVRPADVRYQMGSFGEALRYYRRRFDKEVVEEWKQALREVGSLRGWEVTNGSEGESVKLVVQEVLKELQKAVELVVSDYLVGIDSSVEEVMALVNMNSRATLCMGIYGIGGIGKTTLAKVIYNKLSALFVHRSFIADIRESCNCNGINDLQNKLIFDMQKEKIQFCNSDEGIKYISSRFRDKKVLLVLDDVNTTNQLEALAGNPDWFGPGSRIFVTTRNKIVLDRAGVDIKYEHKLMDVEQSLILFSRHAFQRNCPPSEFLDCSNLVISITGGLPLAIKVVGSFLCGKPPPVWRETIQKMQNMPPHMAVQEKLRIICEELGEDQRNAEDASHATPSPSIPTSKYDYEVFLSFRGVDTRKSFTDYLYYSLVDAGIRVFRDDDELRVGERLSEEIVEAIKISNILIPIISVNYASSKWCLNELAQMMKCKKHSGHIVLPIFYEVEPADVRYQRGRFGEAFHYSGRRFDRKFTEEWKQALIEVSNLRGWQFANGPVGELVKSVVQRVFNELKKAVELDVSENLVGIDSHVEEVMKLINKSSGATVRLGIHGMGGIGKTTLVKVIYNKLSDLFVHRSFIADIRESCNCNGIVYLQNKLISDILGKNVQVSDINEGMKFIRSRFKDKKVLIILDDVNTTDQLEALAGNTNWFGSGSRIFVTTRDESVFDRAGVHTRHKLREMDEDQSLILFSRLAFRRDFPPSDFFAISRLVVNITGGLPLALEVLGSYLCGKPAMLWTETIQKMQNVPHKAVEEKLMVSFDVLEEDQKQMFLDIACFLIGSDARIANYMWEACGFFSRMGIEVLRSLSFIKIGDNHELIMHNQMRDLGRGIVRAENYQEPGKRSRLWDYEEAMEVLQRKVGTSMIEAICLKEGNSTRIADEDNSDYINDPGSRSRTFTDEQFRGLGNLRFLHMSDVNLTGDFNQIFYQLRWLKWGNFSPTFEAINFHPKKLVILDLSGSLISDHWRGWSSMMMAEKLKVLNLTGCQSLESTSYLSAFKILEILIFRDCGKLEQIDPCIGDMETLVSLDLSGCSLLKELPPQVGKLEQLKVLLLDQTMIQKIPSSIGSLKKLETLSAKDCKSLPELPDTIGNLVNLSTLVLSGCVKLVALPHSIQVLQNLEILNISHTEIEDLPNGIGRLKKLQDLDASRCTKLRGKVAKSFRDLSSLQRLDFHGCKELPSLPELPSSLTYLSVTCQSRCGSFLAASFKLEILQILECKFMESVDVSQLHQLRKLSVEFCNSIFEVRGLDKRNYLESLTITHCDLIERLDLSESKDLKKLHARNCKNLVEIHGIDRLKFLEELNISGCASIKRLDLPKPCGLRILDAENCENCVEIQGLDRLEFLERLNICGCISFERLPDLCCFDTLQKLAINNCDKLHDIQSLERFTSCTSLWIEDCTALAKLPNLSNFHTLWKLFLSNCHELREIPGLEDSTSLKHIAISGCSSIEILPDLSSCTNLIKLVVQNCEKLIELRGLEKLEQLVELDISGCKSLKAIPKLSRTRLYQDYEKKPFASDHGMIKFGEDDLDELEWL